MLKLTFEEMIKDPFDLYFPQGFHRNHKPAHKGSRSSLVFRNVDQQSYNENVYAQSVYDPSGGLDVGLRESGSRPCRRAYWKSASGFANNSHPRGMKDEKGSPQTSTALERKDLVSE